MFSSLTILPFLLLLISVSSVGADASSSLQDAQQSHSTSELSLTQQKARTEQFRSLQNSYQVLSRDYALLKKRVAHLESQKRELEMQLISLGEHPQLQEALLDSVQRSRTLAQHNLHLEANALELLETLRLFLKKNSLPTTKERISLERCIRKLDLTLQIRQNPSPSFPQGSLQYAEIVSIDKKSGLLVINAGREQSVRRGMLFTVRRADILIAHAIVAETRDSFSGLLTTQLLSQTNPIRTGDICSIQTDR